MGIRLFKILEGRLFYQEGFVFRRHFHGHTEIMMMAYVITIVIYEPPCQPASANAARIQPAKLVLEVHPQCSGNSIRA
jgi:hypothetical protein